MLSVGFVSKSIVPYKHINVEAKALDHYVKLGSVLAKDGVIRELDERFNKYQGNFCAFYYISKPSGHGKSQVAFTLNRRVVYIPVAQPSTVSQSIYSVFRNITLALREHAAADCFTGDISTTSLFSYTKPLYTVGLLISLLKATRVIRDSAGCEVNSVLLLDTPVEYSAMTIQEGSQAIAALFEDGGNFPVIFLDEVPPFSKDVHSEFNYRHVYFIRNCIRTMGGTCILSGTETSCMNMMDISGAASRNEGVYEFMHLINKLPHVNIEYLRELLLPAKYPLSESVKLLMYNTTPLLATWLLNSMSMRKSTTISVDNLTDVKANVILRRPMYSNIEALGLHAQLYFQFMRSFNNWSNDQQDDLDIGVVDVQVERELMKTVAFRHNYATLNLPSKLENNTVVTIYGCTGQLCYDKDGNHRFTYNTMFRDPYQDPLQHLALLRNGTYFDFKPIPSTAAIALLARGGRHVSLRDVLNINVNSNDGSMLERAMHLASLNASHCGGSLSTGVPFSTWLTQFVHELSVRAPYPTYTREISGLPRLLTQFCVGLLSPPNTTWNNNLSASEFKLWNLKWPANKEEVDGILSDVNTKTVMMSLESKCHKNKVGGEDIKKIALKGRNTGASVGILLCMNVIKKPVNFNQFFKYCEVNRIHIHVVAKNKVTSRNLTESYLNVSALCASSAITPVFTLIIVPFVQVHPDQPIDLFLPPDLSQ